METVERVMKKGTFYGVSVGPGDPELLTGKAVRILRACPVIAAPATGAGRMLALQIAAGAVELEGKTVLPLSFSMTRDRAVRLAEYRAAAEAVSAHLDAGRDVAMVNLGDVSVYATAPRVGKLLAERGYETELVPGVPSFCAAACRLGVSLTEGDAGVHILSGHGNPEEGLDLSGTKVVLKSGRQLPGVLEALAERNLSGRSMLVKNCGLPGEALYPDLSEERPGEDTDYLSLVIVKEAPK